MTNFQPRNVNGSGNFESLKTEEESIEVSRSGFLSAHIFKQKSIDAFLPPSCTLQGIHYIIA